MRAALHAWHVPVHAVLQHTPSAQNALAHSALAEQAAPTFLSPQTPAAQVVGEAQSAFVEQVVLHAAGPQVYGAQALVEPATHLPAPSHVLLAVWVPPLHAPPAQTVPATCFRQAPAPSHEPSVPHVVSACAAHSLSGSAAAAMFPHTPSAPVPFFAALHARQVPPQAESQHTPSTQFPLAH